MNRVLSSEQRARIAQRLQKAQAKRRQHHDRLFNAMILLIVLIVSLLCLGLFIRYVSRGPRVVRKGTESTSVDGGTRPRTITTTTATSATTSETTKTTAEESATRSEETTAQTTTAMPDPSQPQKWKTGTEHYTGDLPSDVKPKHYDVMITLKGVNLATREMKVTGRAEASIEVLKATSKLILKAKASTIKEIKVAVLEVPAAAGEEPRGLNITTLSTSDPFLIVALEEPLEAGKSYTLVTEYDYKSVQGGPISLTAELAKMQLQKGEAHAAFPCFERTGWNVPVALTLQIPRGHSAVANAPMDGQPEVSGSVSAIKFKDTLAMPPDMLAWVTFPTTLNRVNVIPGKMSIYTKTRNVTLQASAKNTLEFLIKYFQGPAIEPVKKIDLVFIKASETQESLGFIVLEETTTPERMCAKIANQWTRILMSQPTDPTWLGSAGVTYLCRLAVTAETKLPAAFLGDLKECKKDTPKPGTRDLLVFRMAHFIVGDAATQKALQNYVGQRVLGSTTTDEELSAFEPDLPKERLVAWRQESYKTNQLDRTFGKTKTITWKNGRDPATPFAQATNKCNINLRAPSAIAVAWLNKSKADVMISIGDTRPVYVNPSMMACYGIQLDPKSWSLIGKDLQRSSADTINSWYLLGEAAKQFRAVGRPHDFTGYMWMWEALKQGDEDLWEEHVGQFVETERQAYSMVTSKEEELKFTARIKELTTTRIKAQPLSVLKPGYKGKNIFLFNLACEISMDICKDIIDSTFGKSAELHLGKTFDPDPLSPEAVACYVGSRVKTIDDFDTHITAAETTLAVRLAFCGCVPKGVIDDHMNTFYDELLVNTPTGSADAAIRVPYSLRERALWMLNDTTQPTVNYTATLKSAEALHLIRTVVEFTAVKAAAKAFPSLTDRDFQGIKDMLVPDDAPLHEWIGN